MIGITNAKIISGGSGGGDTVYAVSETALSKDDKVYLNKHYSTDYEAYKHVKGARNDNESIFDKVAYCFNNGDMVFTYQGDIYWYLYNSSTKGWDYYGLAGNSYTGAFDSFVKMDEYIVRHATGSAHKDAFIFKTKAVVMGGSILRKDLLFTQVSNTQFKLTKIVNPETGELGEDYSTVTVPNKGYFCGVKIEGNTLFYTNSYGNYAFYDITDLTAPILLNSGSTEINTVYFSSGLTPNNYIFGCAGESRTNQTGDLYMYKIDEGLNLVSADDLPDEFYQIKARAGAGVTYNIENNILALAEWNSLYLYKWDGKVFTKLNFDLPEPTEYTPVTGWNRDLYFSQDLKTAFLVGRQKESGNSNNYTPISLYKLMENNDQWYAEDYIHSNAISLHGFATGKTNDKGEYEVSTVLPKVLNVTINTNVDTELELYGSVE
jgi:hypothetical protein